MDENLLWLLVLGPFAQAGLIALAPRRLVPYLGFICSGFAAIFLAIVVHFSLDLEASFDLKVSQAWVPELFVNFSFLADGLGLFFSLLITGVGVLIFIYAQGYMNHEQARIRQFYSLLSIFMGAMLGTVLADNLLVLFLFWEVTGVVSYLLISYEHEAETSRKVSRLAFIITSMTALCMLLGVILVGALTQTLELSELNDQGLLSSGTSLWVSTAMLLLLVGAYGKSAQFPFHFWLPAAMAAPTPISAYLHSATMVKLGIYLIARMYVLFIDHPLWFPLVTSFSLCTVIIGGASALFAYRLKQILAYATISQLGFFISFYGIGASEGLAYDYVHIFNHALYKGSLFMLVGILAHSAHVTDVRHLVGLPKKLPFYSAIFLIALAAMAGLPGTTGFLSKELLVADLIYVAETGLTGLIAVAVLLLGLLLKVAFSYRLFHYFFLSKGGDEIVIHQPPSWKLLISPFLLSSLALAWGIWPQGIEHLARNYFIEGLHTSDAKEIVLWHGWTMNLFISLLLFLGGFLLFQVSRRYEWGPKDIVRPGLADHVSNFLDSIPSRAGRLTDLFHKPYLSAHLYWILSVFSLIFGGSLILNGPELYWPESLRAIEVAQIILIFAPLLVLTLERAYERLIALSFVGFLIVYYFTLMEAPDVAMTQMLIEVATLFVLVLLFFKLPAKAAVVFSWPRALIATVSGCSIALVPTYRGVFSALNPLGEFFKSHSLSLAKGANTVNTIIVDFRALDTLGEVAVVVIAALGVAAIARSGRDLETRHVTSSIPSPILPSIMPLVFFFSIPVAVYITLRGHDYPGGGFSGGMILAISFALLGMSNRKSSFFKLDSLTPSYLMLAGFAICLGSSLISFLAEGSLMQAYFAYGSALLSTPLLFDLGIFLLVIGAVNLVITAMRNRTLLEVDS